MIASAEVGNCPECSGKMVDLGDEFVCRVCGVVGDKEIVESRKGKAPQAVDFTGQALGGYLGPLDYGLRERFSRGLASSSSTFRYLKLVSDFAGREDSTLYSCVKMIERVCEKLSLPGLWSSRLSSSPRSCLESRSSGRR